MKKIFPLLLIVLTALALNHFLKNTDSSVAQISTAKETAANLHMAGKTALTSEQPSEKPQSLTATLNQQKQKPEPTYTMGFHEKTAEFFIKVPRRESLKKLAPSEMHDTPAPVLQAGKELGKMHEYFLTHDHGINVELDFYLKCSQQKDFFDSARALCAARASQLFLKMTGHRISPKIFDDRIAALKDQINL